MGHFHVFNGVPSSYLEFTDFEFWVDTLKERAYNWNWSGTKARAWVQKFKKRLNGVKECPTVSRAFLPFFYAVAQQHSDIERDIAICLDVANELAQFSECSEETEMLNIWSKAHKKTRKAYLQAYNHAMGRRQLYQDSLLRLTSLLRENEGPGIRIEQTSLNLARDAAKQFVEALELEQEMRANLNTVCQKYENVAKQRAVKKVQYLLDTWKTHLSKYIDCTTTISADNTGCSYRYQLLETYRQIVRNNPHVLVEKFFRRNKERFNISELNVNIGVDIDLKTVLGFKPEVKPLSGICGKLKDKQSYLDFSGLAECVFLPPGFKWHGVDEHKEQNQKTSDSTDFVKQQVVVVHNHVARGKHEMTLKKEKVIQQLTEPNELGVSLGFYRSGFPCRKIKTGFFPVKCVSSEARLKLKKSSRRH